LEQKKVRKKKKNKKEKGVGEGKKRAKKEQKKRRKKERRGKSFVFLPPPLSLFSLFFSSSFSHVLVLFFSFFLP